MQAIRIRDDTYAKLTQKKLEILMDTEMRVDLQTIASDAIDVGLSLLDYKERYSKISENRKIIEA